MSNLNITHMPSEVFRRKTVDFEQETNELLLQALELASDGRLTNPAAKIALPFISEAARQNHEGEILTRMRMLDKSLDVIADAIIDVASAINVHR